MGDNDTTINLQARSEHPGEHDDLENTISETRLEIDPTPEEHPSQSELPANPGTDLTVEEDPDTPLRLHRQGMSLFRSFERFGALDDLESAIASMRRADDLAFKGHPSLPNQLDDLAAALMSRFECLGELDDLEGGLLELGRAVSLTPEGHPLRPERLSNIGSLFLARFERLGDLSDLESAISNMRRAIELTPEGHPMMAARLSTLGSTLRARFKRLDHHDDMEDAVEPLRRAVDLTPEGHPDMAARLDNLGTSLLNRFERLGDLEDLKNAILKQRRALDLTPDNHPRKVARLGNLGISLHAHFDRMQSKQNFDSAVECLKAAALRATGLVSTRLACAKRWIALETENPTFGSPEARLQAHTCIMDMLPDIVWLGYSVARQNEELANIANLADEAVCAAINSGDLALAIEWLEASRGLGWSRLLLLNTPINNLAQHQPDLAASLRALVNQLQQTRSSTQISTNRHWALSIQYDSCLEHIRACPGFERFARPPKLADFIPSLEHIGGPVVFFNVHSSRCDALVLFPSGDLKLVPLPGLTQDRANELRARFAEYLQAGEQGAARWNAPSSSESDASFSSLLGRLWMWIVNPVFEALDFTARQERLPHITWCPNGPLTQLPIHAAGLYPETGLSGPHVFDFVVSSYTPSLAILVHALRDRKQQPPALSVLVIAQPKAPATQEGERLHEILSELQIESTVLSGAQATVVSTQSAMSQFLWVHLACHGTQHYKDPMQSTFALSDGELALSSLIDTVKDGAELAFLSACQTAIGEEKIADNCAHLAAGMLAVGFKGVVATMWLSGDAEALIVVEAYYKKLSELRRTGTVAEGSTGAAYALHEAVKCLRESVGEGNFEEWALYVHYGI